MSKSKLKLVAVVSALMAMTASAAAQQDEGPCRLAELVNQSRAEAGLSELADQAQLAEVAEEHSRQMAGDKSIYHNSHRSEKLMTRSSENVARAPDCQSAHDALMKSPPHRTNVLDPSINSAGIAAIRAADGDLYITQLFAVYPEPVELRLPELDLSPVDPSF